MTDEQYLNAEDMMVTSLNKEQLDKLAELSMQSIKDADINNTTFSEIETKYKCLVTNQEFKMIYLNAGWLMTEKCICCGAYIHTNGDNHRKFWESHILIN